MQPAPRSRRITSTPVIPGICRSRMAKSGCRLGDHFQRRGPSEHCPRIRMPWRRTTRRILPAQWHDRPPAPPWSLAFHKCSSLRPGEKTAPGLPAWCPSGRFRYRVCRPSPRPARGSSAARFPRPRWPAPTELTLDVESHAIVLDLQNQAPAARLEGHLDPGRLGVPDQVGKRLLGRTVNQDLDFLFRLVRQQDRELSEASSAGECR